MIDVFGRVPAEARQCTAEQKSSKGDAQRATTRSGFFCLSESDHAGTVGGKVQYVYMCSVFGATVGIEGIEPQNSRPCAASIGASSCSAKTSTVTQYG